MFRRTTIRMLAVFVTGTFLTTAASAAITASHELWSEGTLTDGSEYISYRFRVQVTDTEGTGPDDWTAAELRMELVSGVFYQDLLGANPPNPALFTAFPDLEFDSYCTSPGDYPNAAYDGAIVGEVIIDPGPPPWRFEAEWFDTIDTGNGDFVIAQATVLPTDSDWIAMGHLRVTSRDSAGEWFDHYFVLRGTARLPGDTDNDGDVDLEDLAVLLAAYRTCVGDPDYNPDADFDDDGCVNLSDLAALLANYGFGT